MALRVFVPITIFTVSLSPTQGTSSPKLAAPKPEIAAPPDNAEPHAAVRFVRLPATLLSLTFETPPYPEADLASALKWDRRVEKCCPAKEVRPMSCRRAIARGTSTMRNGAPGCISQSGPVGRPLSLTT